MMKKIHASEKKESEGLNEDMVAAQGIVFLAAGFETTSSTMSLLLFNLAKNPLIQEKVYAEIANVLENNEEDKIIVHWALFSTLLYAVLMMEQAGSLMLNIIFNQFSTEMINQQMVSKRANLRVLKK